MTKSEYFTEEVRKRMSESAKRRWTDKAERSRLIAAQTTGKLESEKFRTKNIGKTHSAEWKTWMKEEHLPKMVAGWKASAKWKEAVSKANNSPEHLEQMKRMRENPEIQSKRICALRLAAKAPILRENHSRNFKKMWLNPSYREKKMDEFAHTATKNTGIELALQEELMRRGIPFLVGVPIHGVTIADIQLTDSRVLIFADGCYWHQCPAHCRSDKNGRGVRDERITNQLRLYGWTVFRFWEHEIKADASACIDRVVLCLNPGVQKQSDSTERELSIYTRKDEVEGS